MNIRQLISLAFSVGTFDFVGAQIPNNDFENWTQVSVDVPSGGWQLVFGKVTKTSDGHNGTKAVRLQADTTPDHENPGVMLTGNSDNGKTFYGGIPFAAKPDSLVMWMKYNIASGDTGLVLILFKKNGVELSRQWLQFTQFANGYTRKAFKINYTVSGQTPDSLIFGFVSTNVFNKINGNSWMQIDDISWPGTTVNIPDPGFENWSVKTHQFLNSWSNNYFEPSDLMGNRPASVKQTTDKATGTYALTIENIVSSTDTIWGGTSTHPDDKPWSNGGDFPVSKRYDTLYGLYKWLPQNGDSFSFSVTFYKSGSNVGGGYWSSGVSVGNYTIFKIPVSYNNGSVVPDSSRIEIRTSWNRPKGNSKMFIDNLNFNPVYGLGLYPGKKEPEFIFYPNPAQSELHVVVKGNSLNLPILLFNSTGQLVKTIVPSAEDTAVSVSDLPPGTYLFKDASSGATGWFIKK